MMSQKTPAGHVIRLDRGDEVLTALTTYVREAEIMGGVITGIGAVKDATLGYFHLPTREYHKQEFPEEMELVSFYGNITQVDDGPMVHAHVTLSGADYIAKAGHLFSATVAVTGEFFLWPADTPIHRALDPDTGLKLMVEGKK